MYKEIEIALEEIALECVFCNSTEFETPDEDYIPQPGELIKCGNCGKLNDYSSLEAVIDSEAEELSNSQADKIIQETINKIDKMLKR